MTVTPGSVVIRTGGGVGAGFGHVRRCLTLATALREAGADCSFVLDGDPAALAYVRTHGFDAVPVAAEDDLGATMRHCAERRAARIVVDSYDLSTAYHRALADAGLILVAIDDLADRDLPVDVIVNGTPGAENLPYRPREGALLLLGPRYALLRREFALPVDRPIRRQVARVLITLGGFDRHRLAQRVVEWTLRVLGPIAVDLVRGPLDAADGAHAQMPGVTIRRDPADMRALMLAADLAVCGGGQTSFELAATGTPALAIQLAANQSTNLRALSSAGSLVTLGCTDDPELRTRFAEALASIAGDVALRAQMSERGRALFDGAGASRVAAALLARSRGGPK